MKKLNTNYITLSFVITLIILSGGCKKKENPVKYEKGTFPDSIINVQGINSAYDDYNLNMWVLNSYIQLIFSSNRASNGGQFDLVQGAVTYIFDQTTGEFALSGEMTNDLLCSKIITKVNTTGNDFGPYRLYSPVDGYEYMILSSQNGNGDLDFYYTKNLPNFGTNVPEVSGPFPASLLNSGSNDAYICFDTNQDSAYFASDAGGNFDIYIHQKPADIAMESWLSQPFSASSKVDALNSEANDICPFVHRKIMVFASNRDGGLGGYDLYYSLFSGGKWSTPKSFDTPINTSSNEYRPVLGSDDTFTNYFLMFSSDRPGGKGGFDLYFTGVKF
ncbi:MAG: hypothetical protein Q8868_04275 [Bacteroidota bacterium]|nr:hypothetical protein [Bacteroidota bacterium]